MSLLCMSQEFSPLDKKLLHRHFLDNHIFILMFCWHGWGGSWITCLISLKRLLCDWILGPSQPLETLEKGCPGTLLAFYPEHFFLTVMFLILVSFKNLYSQEHFISRPASFLIKLFPLPYIFALTFDYKKQEESKPHL